MSLTKLQQDWRNTPEYHTELDRGFRELVNNDELLNKHRTFIEQNIYGMGERSFQWFWKLMVDELPENFKFIEIGVHKGQIISLIRLLADRIGKQCTVYGITPMNGVGTGWREDDYEGDIAKIHTMFNLEQPTLYKGLSTDKEALRFAIQYETYDALYVDGDHSREGALFDLVTYGQMVKHGGYLVIDDACNDLNFPPSGFFTGIDTVTEATLDYLKKYGHEWEFQFNLVHLRIYKRK